MGTNTISKVTAGNPAGASDLNDIVDALRGHHVPRRTDTGAADTAKNYDLGTLAYQWRNLFLNNLYINDKLVDFDNIGQDSNNSVQSGATRANSIMADFIRADGTDLEATILATATPLAITANNVSVSVTSDILLSGITAAPSSNNTALVNGSYSGESSKIQGERGTHIGIDNIGTEISDRVGQFAAFEVNDDIFIGLIESDKISSCRRGFFFDENADPIDRQTIANNDTITLLSLGWVFLQSDGATTDITYKSPAWQYEEPTDPDTDDYWFDQVNEVWKRYDGAAFVTVDRILIGWVVADTTSCIASRSVDFKRAYNPHIDLEVERVNNTQVQSKQGNVFIDVYANPINYGWQRITWDITTDLESGLTEASSTNYYLYVTEDGEPIISDKQPYDRRIDLRGWYHPYESWRYCGTFLNDGSSNITTAGSNNSGAGGLIATQVFTSNGTFRKSDYPSARYVRVTCVGGGGGGGGAHTTSASTNNGSNGGTSSFGSHLSATGGGGGTRRIDDITPKVIPPPNPGNGSGGDINISGQKGTHGFAYISEGDFHAGGNSPLGFGFGGVANSFTDLFWDRIANGTGYGAGGAGGCRDASAAAGSGGGLSKKRISAETLSDDETVTVGAGGSGGMGAGGSNDGSNGSNGVVIVEVYE